MTPEELDACIGQWRQWEENRIHTGWEQVRLAGYLTLLPYAKKKVREPRDLFRFAWEVPSEIPTENPLSKEAFQQEFKRVANRYG